MTGAERTRAQELADRLLAAAEHLERGEIAYVTGAGLVLGRSSTGKLRAGFGAVSFYWPRGDAAEMVREYVETHLDWTQTGYFVARYRQDIEAWLDRPDAYRADGIGRGVLRVDRDSRRLLLLEHSDNEEGH